MNKFKKGDTVRIKGKHQTMTVNDVFGGHSLCTWDLGAGVLRGREICDNAELEMVGYKAGGLEEKVSKLIVLVRKKDEKIEKLWAIIREKDRKIESIEEDREKLGSMIDDKDETMREFAEDNKRLEKMKHTDSIINHMNNEKIEELEKEIKRLEEQI